MMKKSIAMAAAAVFSLGLAGGAMADGAATFAAKGCAGCHGADAKTPIMPVYPKLAGQNAEYAIAQMKDIKSGARAGGQTMVMKPIMAAVTDAEIDEIGKWLATLK